VEVDQKAIGRGAAEFLIRFRHRRILYAHAGPGNDAFDRRFAGYREVMDAAGLSVDEALVLQEPIGEYSSTWPSLLREALHRRPFPTALVMNHRSRALHVLDLLQTAGLRVPEDISLILFDDDPTLASTTPSVTCMRQPLEPMGRLAIEMILEPPRAPLHESLAPELIVRQSVAPPRRDPAETE
jgi:LacI family transcriptional regulator